MRVTEDPTVVLRRHFGHSGFRPGQRDLVDAVLRGRDAVGILPTGGGKSLCYQVPALLLPKLTVVVSPLVSLMADQLRRAREAGLAAEAIHAGLPTAERQRVEEALRERRLRVLLVAPERFESPAFARLLPELRASLLTIDEAHCISMWGHDFRPSYRKLGPIRKSLGVPALALTATATPQVRQDIERSLGLRDPVRVVGSFDRPNLLWAVQRVPPGLAGREAEAWRLVRRLPGARMVYAATRGRVEQIRNALARRGLHAEAYHAGLAPEERARVQAYFLGESRPVVVATNAFGMGIDRPDVRLVVHDQLPGSLEDYYQESGRAGRDGRAALCLAFFHPEDRAVHRAFLDRTHPPVRGPAEFRRLLAEGRLLERRERRRTGAARMEGVGRYARSRGCRRQVLLAWFGERAPPGPCEGCDRCLGMETLLARVTVERA